MIGREVAIKDLHLPDGVPSAERQVFEQRVLREDRTAGRLNDPAVVTVHDVLAGGGTACLAMELVQAVAPTELVVQQTPLTFGFGGDIDGVLVLQRRQLLHRPAGAGAVISAERTVDCSESHDFEICTSGSVFGTSEYDVAYPGEEELNRFGAGL